MTENEEQTELIEQTEVRYCYYTVFFRHKNRFFKKKFEILRVFDNF